MTTNEPPRKRKRLSKNKKKSWKHTDVAEVEEYLEDKRLQERTGGLVSEKTDAELFFIDKETVVETTGLAEQKGGGARKKRREKKLLRCEANLLPDSRVPPVTVKHNVKHPEKKWCKAKRERLAAAEMLLTQKRRQQPTQGNKKVQKPQGATFDLWGDNDINKLSGDSHYLEITKKKRVQPRTRQRAKPSGLAAVDPPHPGASYNPSFEDHQDLLQKALDVEIQREKEEQKIHRALDMQFPKAHEAPTEASYIAEMSAGIFEEDDDESDEGHRTEAGDPDRLSVNPPVRREDKKTVAQRNKEKRQKMQQEAARARKEQRQRDQQKFRLKSIKADLKVQAELLAQRRKKKEEMQNLHKDDPKKLGKLKYEAQSLELKLSDELEGSLRLLKPEGSLISDRFHSLQRRNLIETRQRAKVGKKYKRKKFERKGHKEITT